MLTFVESVVDTFVSLDVTFESKTARKKAFLQIQKYFLPNYFLIIKNMLDD